MLDEGFIRDPIATRSMMPLLQSVAEVLTEIDADPTVGRRIAETVGAAYTAGLTDGARHAIGEVAIEAERHGLRLKLAPELEAVRQDA